MALTLDQLKATFTFANAGTAPTAGQIGGLTAILNQNASGTYTDAQATQAAIDLGSDLTTAVSVQTYQFFLGFAPSQAGLTALNAAYTGSGAQANLNGENRYLAQSISLALQNPTAKASFAATYGVGSISDATKLAYNVIVGNAAAAAAGINIDSAVSFLTSAASVKFYTDFVKANVPGIAAADIDLAVRAALVGEIIYQATIFNNGAGVGSYATAANNLIKDLADDGALVANNAAGIDLFANYGSGSNPNLGKTYALTNGVDTITAGNGNDTFTGIGADGIGSNLNVVTFSTQDTLDGGAGVDTLNLVGNNAGLTVAAASVKNIEILNLQAGGAITADVSGFAGLNSVTVDERGTGNVAITTKANVTTVTTSALPSNVSSVTVTDAGTTTSGVTTDAVTSLNVTSAGNVTLNSDKGTSISVSGTTGTVTLNNGLAHAASFTLNNYTGGSVVDTAATSVDVKATGSAVSLGNLNVGSATALTFSGDKLVTVTGGTLQSNIGITSGAGGVDVSAFTFGTGFTFAGGAGNDAINVTSGATKALTLGAGDDSAIINGAFGVGGSLAGGDGVDTLVMTSATATSLASTTTFNGLISGFEGLKLTDVLAASTTTTLNLARLGSVSAVASAGSVGANGFESATFNFTGNLYNGQSITIGGATYTNTTGGTLNGAQVAAAVQSIVTGYNGVATGSQVVYTATTAGDLTNLTASVAPAAITAPTLGTITQGKADVPATNETATVTFGGLLAGESTTVDNYRVTATAVTETAAVTFGNLTNGQTLTVNGVTVTATGNVNATEVATAFATGANTANTTVTGSQSALYTASAAGAVVTYTATTAGANVNDIAITGANAGTASAPVITQGTNGNLTAAQVASIFAAVNPVVAGVNGAQVADLGAHVYSRAANGTTGVNYTGAVSGNVSDLSVASTSGSTAPTVSAYVQGTNLVAGNDESVAITFNALKDGQTLNVDGRTVTATGGDLTAVEVANIYLTGVSTSRGTYANLGGNQYNVSENGTSADSVLTLTYATAKTNATDLTVSTTNVAQPSTLGGTTPTAQTNGSIGGSLTLNNFAANGTFELNGTNAGTVTINLADNTGTADVLNVKLNGAANLVNTGTIVAAGVETVNITATDSTLATDPAAVSTPNLVADDATKVVVTGNHGVNFTGSSLAGLTTLDASGVVSTNTTGASAAAAITFTAAASTSKTLSITTGMGDDVINLSANTKGSTINTGAGVDTITGTGGADTINAGAGNDTVFSTSGADTVTLGDGKDTYQLNKTIAGVIHSTLTSTQTLTDFAANTAVISGTGNAVKGANLDINVRTGDVIDVSNLLSHVGGASVAGVVGGNIGGIAVGVYTNASDAQTFIQTTFQNTANTGFALDSSTGKLYLDVNHDGNIDAVINLTGVTTLTTAAFITGIA